MTRSTAHLLATSIVPLALASACATLEPSCQQEIDACLERCQASGGSDVEVEHVSPEQSLSYCEERCRKCRESTTPPPKGSGPPTHTGNAR